MNALRIRITLLFMIGCALGAATCVQAESASKEMGQSAWNGEFRLSDVRKTDSRTMWELASPSKRATIATFFGYNGTELCSYLTGEVGKRIADWDLRFVATAVMNAGRTEFEAKNLISSIDEVPLVSTITDKCAELTSTSDGRTVTSDNNPLLIVTNRFVPGKKPDFALWTDNEQVLGELSAGWADLGTQSGGQWTRKHFDWPEGSATPQVGALVKATQRNHLYADYLRYRDETERWVEGPIVAVIHSGDRFHVDAVKELGEGSVWAKIRPPSVGLQ